MSILWHSLPKLSVATRIRAGFAALVLLGLVASLMSVQRERAADLRTHRFVELSARKDIIAQASQAIDRLQIAETNFRQTSSKPDLEVLKRALAEAEMAMSRVADSSNQSRLAEQVLRLQAMLHEHAALEKHFSALTRSAQTSSIALGDVGGRLSASVNEFVAELDQSAPAEQSYAVHLIDRRIFLMRLVSTHFRLEPSADGASSFEASLHAVDKAMDMAKPVLGEMTHDLPPLRDLLHEYGALFASWSASALEADHIYTAQLKPGLDAMMTDLRRLDADFSELLANEAVAATAASHQSIVTGVVHAAACLAFGVLLAMLTVRSLIPPLRSSTARMLRLAEGDVDSPIQFTDLRDEIGDMARALEVFAENTRRADAFARADQAAQAARLQRSAALERLIANFESSSAAATRKLTDASSMMESTARDLAATAEQTAAQSMGVSGAAEQTSNSVRDVAGATEQLAASIQEISRQVSQSANVAQRALEGARKTDTTVQKLAEGAHKIGEVVQLINSIAGQTNLLALNATIEAARAGDAGKGFAVVASEVKALATQTAKATDDIGAQISSIQAATNLAVAEIGQIAQVIAEINQIGVAIAAAIDEQGAATSLISHNIDQAAQGTQNVNHLIGDVREAAGRTGAAAENMHRVSASVAEQAVEIVQEIDRFTSGVKAA